MAALDGWLDRFFESFFRHRPVDATFVGEHRYDDRLPDFSARGVDELLGDTESLLRELDALPEEELDRFQAIDKKLARGFLEIQMWELESGHFHRKNPAWYTGEAIFGVFSLLLRDFAPETERFESANARLSAIPRLLHEGRRNVRAAPRVWTERARRECDGALAFLREGIRELPGLRGDEALSAFVTYGDFLDSLPDETTVACGEEAFSLLLRSGHCLDWSANEILERAQQALSESEAELESRAARFGADDWREALAQLADHHPPREKYYDRYQTFWDESRVLAESSGLLTWPDYPVDYRPRPKWSLGAAPHLYFLFYRAPAPLDALPRVEYLVTPLPPELSEDEAERILRATNDSVIKLNHVVHHGGIGHHIQNWHANRARSRLGRIAAVDGASRIAMFCGGTMAEGWASYATDLMDEAGFLTPLESYSQHHAHARAAARAIADVELHHGRMSFSEAERFYEARTNMSAAAARSEVTKNSMFPGAAVTYFVGATLIHELRRELESLGGFELRSFHDEFLSYGSVPVRLVADRMREGARAI